MSKELEAFERIKDDLEYVTRLDYVSPIVRGEVRDELYKIYHRELPDLDIIETALNRLEELEEVLSFIKEHVLLDGSILRADFQWDLDIEENGELLKEYLK